MAQSLKQYVGHRVREALTHGSRLIQRRQLPRLVILPCASRAAGSANLRGWEIGASLRRLGWRVTVIPAQCELEQRLRIIKWEKPDLILIQKGRHPLNWPHHYGEIALAFDLDDADFLDPKQAEQLAACCAASRAVFAGSRYIADWCSRYNSNVTVVWTGGVLPKRPPRRSSSSKPILTWASSDAPGYPLEAELVREIVRRLTRKTPLEFWLYGVRPSWDPEFLKSFTSLPVPVRPFPFMSHGRLIESMNEVAVGLNPICVEGEYSRGKSFGKVLPYLSAQVAVVTSNQLEMPYFFRHGENGFLVDSIDEWVECTQRLLTEPELRQEMVERAFADFQSRLTTDSAARKVDGILRAVLTQGADRTKAQG